LDLQKLLLEDKLSYKISVAENLETQELKIPPMLFQPYVENAIVHGIELKQENGNVHINFELLENSRLKVTIEDDGLGREKVAEIYKKRNLKHLSFSTNITSERIELLNVKSKNRIEIKTENILVNELISGTKVTLILPVTNVFD
jgi:LytS/YehU family sensor histidine kinase